MTDDFRRLLTYPKSNLAGAIGLKYFEIIMHSENPDIYSVFLSAMGNYTHLKHFKLIIKRDGTPTERRRLEKQIIDFVDEYFAKEQRTKSWPKKSKLSTGRRYFYLQWE
jgi:hypothetical protein